MKLTERLAAAAALVPSGSTIADIGTDHGYLPVHVCQQGICRHAVAADVAPGPLEAAISHVRGAGLEGYIDCRLGDGLSCLRQGEVDGVVICGMGGPLMVRILDDSRDLWQSLQFAVLQPQSESGVLRQFLYDHAWHIEEETLCIDSGRLYEIMRAVPGRAEPLPAWMYEVGPMNWARRSPLLKRRIELILSKKKHVAEGLEKSRSDVQLQVRTLRQEIAAWEERLCQLQ